MADEEDGGQVRGYPRMVFFVVPLPDPLPVVHGEVYSRVFEERVDGLEDIEIHVSPGVPLAEEDRGRQLAVAQFWQVQVEADLDLVGLEAAGQVLSEVTGRQPDGSIRDRLDPVETYRTVAWTGAWASEPPAPDGLWGNVDPDPFTRCVDLLAFVVRGYRLSEGARIPELTYERLPRTVHMVFKDRDNGEFLDHGLLNLTHFNVRGAPAPEILDEDRTDRLHLHLDRLRAGDPIMLFGERMLGARVALWQDGDFGAAVVQAALACEVLLDAVLGLMLWEEQLDTPDTDAAVTALTRPLKPRVRNEYARRLGGDWSMDGDGPLARWAERVAHLRGRVVHRGYRPTQDDAYYAVETSVELLDFIKARLADRVTTYRRTALLVLGEPGLRTAGAWRKVERFATRDADNEPWWIPAYGEWRDTVDARL